VNDKADQFTGSIIKHITANDTLLKNIAQPLQQVTAITGKVKKYEAIADKQQQKADSLQNGLENIPTKYIKKVDAKMELYTNRVNKRTIKTLERLSKWEKKIQPMIQKANPYAAQQLFKPEQTFTSLLQKVKSGESLSKQYHAEYSTYTDKLTTKLKYLQQQKDKLNTDMLGPVAEANKKVTALNTEEDKAAAIQQFIKERRKQLAQSVVQYLGKCKYLDKINKEDWYYVNTLKNYKELFSDPQKAEKAATGILNKIPAYQQFAGQNSQLASLFGLSSGGSTAAGSDANAIAGLQSRSSVESLMKESMGGAGPNVQGMVSQNMQQAQEQLDKLKTQANKYSSTGDMPDFKPNTQKTKTFSQRLEYGANFQFGKSNNWVPGAADIAGSIGYKLNDKSTIGLGLSYKLGLGTIEHIQFTHQGIGIRSFIDWKLKKQFFISGGFEMNHMAAFKKIKELKNTNDWQQSALLGVTKKMNIKTKLFKGQSIQLLYDFLYRQHVPASQPIIFRVGYKF
ncbi:MAG: hypothetical protein HY305_00370, partial [Sphingobacteriales bacterium]|nr:hypothetical protein [Sphingobacteriales bacterium]